MIAWPLPHNVAPVSIESRRRPVVPYGAMSTLNVPGRQAHTYGDGSLHGGCVIAPGRAVLLGARRLGEVLDGDVLGLAYRGAGSASEQERHGQLGHVVLKRAGSNLVCLG
jgi:hypothetical protein